MWPWEVTDHLFYTWTKSPPTNRGSVWPVMTCRYVKCDPKCPRWGDHKGRFFQRTLVASVDLFTWIWMFKHKSHLYWFIYTKWLLWALCNSHGRTLCVSPLKLACFYDCLSIKKKERNLYILFQRIWIISKLSNKSGIKSRHVTVKYFVIIYIFILKWPQTLKLVSL